MHNGELTERGFARAVGISQPHIHKVLKGASSLSIENFDLILKNLNCTLLDLCTEAELRKQLASVHASRPACVDLPLQQGHIGPGFRWEETVDWQSRYSVPCGLLDQFEEVKLVRIAADSRMRLADGRYDFAVLDTSPGLETIVPQSIYAVDRGQDSVLRHIRRGVDVLYLVPDDSVECPENWERVSTSRPSGGVRVQGRLIWLGRHGGGGIPVPQAPGREPISW